jgi:hypothetical protein
LPLPEPPRSKAACGPSATQVPWTNSRRPSVVIALLDLPSPKRSYGFAQAGRAIQ